MTTTSIEAGRPGYAQKTRLDLPHLKSLARDRWPTLLQAAGIDAAFLRKKHGPCPVCGGKDRFRFTDRDGRGCFVCNHHRPNGGDGFQLLADWLRCDFLGAARWVADFFGGQAVAVAIDPAELARRAAREQAEQERLWTKARARNAALWQEARSVDADSPAGLYLAGRGLVLDHYPKALRFHPALPYWQPQDGKPVQLGHFPALLAAVQAADGTPVALHKTYLDADGHKADVPSVKKWSSPSGATRGAAVRLYPAGPQLAITEGVETALAVHCANGLPVWAGLSAYGMAQAVLPNEAVEVFVFADHDDNGTGQHAANTLAARLLAEGRTVRVLLPSAPGRDWLDVLVGGRV